MSLTVTREEVAPGIARLIVPTATLPPATATNAWLLGDEHLTIVDPGASDPAVQAAVVEALAGDRVERIVLTHHHPDHTSGARHLAAATGAPVVGHPDTEPLFGPLDATLREGDTLAIGTHSWAVVHTPGHAHGHICLTRASDGHAVVGDLLAGEGTILIAPPEGHLATYLHSLARMRDLGIQTALPAHGPALDAQASLALYLHHRNHRSEQVRDVLADGPASPIQLARTIYAELPPAVHQIAALQLNAHLTWWIEQDAVVRPSEDTFAWSTPS